MNALEKRLKALEETFQPEVWEQPIIFISCCDMSKDGKEEPEDSFALLPGIPGTPRREMKPGKTIHSEPGETLEQFETRVNKEAKEFYTKNKGV